MWLKPAHITEECEKKSIRDLDEKFPQFPNKPACNWQPTQRTHRATSTLRTQPTRKLNTALRGCYSDCTDLYSGGVSFDVLAKALGKVSWK